MHVSQSIAATAGRAEPALQPLLSTASVRALDLAKARAAQLKPAAPEHPRVHKRMPRNRRFKLAQLAAQQKQDDAAPDA